jgi:hypothetical protein
MNPNRTLSPFVLKTISVITGLVVWQIISEVLPAYTEYVDTSFVDEAKKQLGLK